MNDERHPAPQGILSCFAIHLIRSASTPLTRGESQAPATHHSPSSLKGWQSKTGGVDAHHINQHIIPKKFTPNLPRNASLKNKAKALRKAGVLSEVLFWQQVHRKKFYSIDFDRQCIIGNYIVDFYVPSLSLIIEIDGQSHEHKGVYDEQRQSFLTSLGLHIYRIQDADVKSDLSNVTLRFEDFIIQSYAVERHPVPQGILSCFAIHLIRSASTPLTRGESQAPASNNSPSSLKGWQSKTGGVDAKKNKTAAGRTHHHEL